MHRGRCPRPSLAGVCDRAAGSSGAASAGRQTIPPASSTPACMPIFRVTVTRSPSDLYFAYTPLGDFRVHRPFASKRMSWSESPSILVGSVMDLARQSAADGKNGCAGTITSYSIRRRSRHVDVQRHCVLAYRLRKAAVDRGASARRFLGCLGITLLYCGSQPLAGRRAAPRTKTNETTQRGARVR
jgi:hypothetical protein